MGQGSESRESEDRINEPRTVGAIHIVPYTAGIGLHFPPLRAAGSEAALARGDIDGAVAALDLDPHDDIQATGAVKKHLAGVLLRRVAAQLMEQRP